MLNPQHPPTGSGLAVRRWVAGLLVLAGAAMLAWSAALVIDARLSQDGARQSLERATRAQSSAAPHDVIGALRPATAIPIAARGSPIAELLIPRVRLSSIVLHGSDARTLRRGPGHLETTPLPGERGNVAIAGHRDTFFRQLRDVKVGDDIFVNTPRGAFHYRITSARVVNARDVSVLEPTDDEVLTLVTCYPFWVLGPAPDRFVVRAARIEESRATVIVSRPIAAAVPGPVPSLHAEAADDRAGLAAPALDDDALIRLAIERFRVVYNGRLITHDEQGDGLLQLTGCEVTISGDQADATCEASFSEQRAGPHHLRRLTLTRTDGAWTIRSTTD